MPLCDEYHDEVEKQGLGLTHIIARGDDGDILFPPCQGWEWIGGDGIGDRAGDLGTASLETY